MPLASNEDWLTYLQNSSHWQWPLVLLVSVHQNPLINIEAAPGDENIDEEFEEANIEAGGTAAPQCVADEGKNIPFIVEQLQDEERELDEAMNADSSDDDDDVPEESVSSDFSHLVVDDGSSVPLDCRENEIVQGARYHSIEEVKEAVKCWSLSLMREFKTVECKSRKYDVVCVKEGCPWRVHAYKGKWKDYCECSIVTQHTCHLPGVQKTHRKLTSQYIANEMYRMIVENISYEPKSIIRYI
jgi:hypothetical protein